MMFFLAKGADEAGGSPAVPWPVFGLGQACVVTARPTETPRCHGELDRGSGFALRSREVRGGRRQRVAGAWTPLPGGATTVFLALWPTR